jgi:hypothetical protein
MHVLGAYRLEINYLLAASFLQDLLKLDEKTMARFLLAYTADVENAAAVSPCRVGKQSCPKSE